MGAAAVGATMLLPLSCLLLVGPRRLQRLVRLRYKTVPK